jgi:hypothetical protein
MNQNSHNIEDCKEVFVTWKWSLCTIITFLVVSISAGVTFGYKMAAINNGINDQKARIVVVERTIDRLNIDIIRKLDTLTTLIKEGK